jgi:hypothetical protein
MRKMNFILTLLYISIFSYGQSSKLDISIKEANMLLYMPNYSWKLVDYQKGNLTQYIFKRESINNKSGSDIIPAIMIYIDDAREYKQDITTYSMWKQKPFMEKGVKVDKILTWNDIDYPLSYTNSLFYKCHYTADNIEHILYMIHIINKRNKGIQIYMDITKDVDEQYIGEFMAVLKSIKEQK